MLGKVLVGGVAFTTVLGATLIVGVSGIGIGLGSGYETVPTACTGAPTSVGVLKAVGGEFNTTELGNAALIAKIGIGLKLTQKQVTVGVATSMQEAHLENLTVATNLDSLGLFQQRPSQGWGTAAQLVNPVYATNAFFSALVKVGDISNMSLIQAAEAVQRPNLADYARSWTWDWVATALTDEAYGQPVPLKNGIASIRSAAYTLVKLSPKPSVSSLPPTTVTPTASPISPSPLPYACTSSVTSSNTSGNDYPAKWADPAQDSVVDTWRMYNRECVSFVAWKLSSVEGYQLPLFIGQPVW